MVVVKKLKKRLRISIWLSMQTCKSYWFQDCNYINMRRYIQENIIRRQQIHKEIKEIEKEWMKATNLLVYKLQQSPFGWHLSGYKEKKW